MDERTSFLVENETIFCHHCGKKNDASSNFCCWCGANLAMNTKTNKSRKKKPGKTVLRILIIALIAVFLSAFLISRICFHEWTEATCEQSRTCSKCGKTEGDALGHDWADATCTVAQRCKTCSAVKGVPLGHTPGEESRQMDPDSGSYRLLQYCTLCHNQVADRQLKLESFVENDRFILSPQDFLDRMSALARESFPDFHYEFGAERGTFMVHLFLTNTAGPDGTLLFMTKESEAIAQEDFSEPGVWCFSLTDTGSSDQLGVVLSSDIMQLLFLACDPLLTEEDLAYIIPMKLGAALNSTEGNPFGYIKKNELLYEFGHIIFENLAIENIQIYAADWISN